VKLIILDLAEADLLNGFSFYEEQHPGIGSYFLESLYSDIESLRLYSGIHLQERGYYRQLSKRFPFAIYYRIEGNTTSVWRVLDCRRNPRWITRQLKQKPKRS